MNQIFVVRSLVTLNELCQLHIPSRGLMSCKYQKMYLVLTRKWHRQMNTQEAHLLYIN